MRLVRWFLPPEASQWTEDELRRARILLLSTLVLVTGVVIQALINLARSYPVGLVQFAPFLAVVALTLWLVKSRGNVVVAVHLLLGAATVTLSAIIALKRGLGATPPLGALLLVPVLATLVAGVGIGAAWLGVTTLTIVGLIVADRMGLVVSDQMDPGVRDTGDMLMFALLGALLFGLTWTFDAQRRLALDAALKREAELRESEVERVEAVARRQMAEAQRLTAIGQLAAATAHEINNPLSYVINNMIHLKDSLAEVRPELREALAEALDGARRVGAITRGLQSFARTEANFAYVDVAAALNKALRLTSGETRHRARIACDIASLPKLWANEGALVQVFTNLLINAAQALPEGNHPSHVISVHAHAEADRCVVVIEDNGPGIPEDVAAKIFDPFFTTKPIGRGTGLGLAVCRNIVTNHGGSIVHEAGDPGARFKVTIPFKEGRTSVDSAPPPSIRRGPVHARILIVDDDTLVARSLARSLREHEVTVVHSGREALERLCDDERFDVIFCDLMMPDLTGMDLFEAVRESYPGLQERMIFMTGGAFTERARSFCSSVENPLVPKPLDIARISELLASRFGDVGTTEPARLHGP